MKIETRVEKLELELKLLKSEIQRTLLDIQEQILIHYYPSLRAEEAETPERLNAMMGSLQAERQTLNQKRAASSAAEILFDDEDDDRPVGQSEALSGAAVLDDEALRNLMIGVPAPNNEGPEADDVAGANGLHLREVSISDLRRGSNGHNGENGKHSANGSNGHNDKPANGAGRMDFAALADWVTGSVASVGKERSKKAVDAYAVSGYLAPEIKQLLYQLIALSEQDGDPAVGPNETIEVLVRLSAILGQA